MSGFFVAWGVGWFLLWACGFAMGMITKDDDFTMPGIAGMVASVIYLIAVAAGIAVQQAVS